MALEQMQVQYAKTMPKRDLKAFFDEITVKYALK